ncbi:uncharacterized protein LOC143244402 [Tachypleus tridentatus]|uniref:uncharacterized protein LOC143244402 n=1 Tax=Tachypleus tridentatus TaxID=6853 RepID=UPI003FD245DD
MTPTISWSLLLIFLSMLLYPHQHHCMTECVEGCMCKWKNGKQTAECADSQLTSVPAGLNTGTQVLDLSGNLLQTLSSKVFQSVGLVNLQKVFLARCGISEIANDAFYYVSNLIELDLSENFLNWVPFEALKDCSLLRRLQLTNNPIQLIQNNTFSGLIHLTSLEMSNCRIYTIEPNAFSGLESLEYLRLDGNKLSFLSGKVVQDLPNLHTLDLYNNPWVCDCRISKLRKWMISQNVAISTPPRCELPLRVQGLTWDIMNIDDFACPPNVIGVDTKISIVEGRNATLRCKIRAVPTATINWLWQGRVITNLSLMSFGQQMYLIQEEGKDLKESILTIINVMVKDGGRYVCVASNHAGNVTVNVSVEVSPRINIDTSLSGGEIAGIVIGLFLVISLLFVVVCFLALYRRRNPSDERKSFGVNLYKNFDSVKQNHVELTALNNEGPEDEKPIQSKQQRGNSGYFSDATTSMPCQVDHDDASSSSTVLIKPDTVMTTVGGHPSDVHLCSPVSTQEPRDSDVWRYALREEGDGSSFSANETDQFENVLSPSKQDSTLNPFNEDNFQTHSDRTLPKDCKSGGECHQTIGPPPHGSFAHYLLKPNHFHLDLSSEARDSPDEGLGDEREYETDILD